MKGFIKIAPKNYKSSSKKNRKKSKVGKIILRGGIVLTTILIFLGVFGLIISFTLKESYIQAQKTAVTLSETFTSLKNQNIDETLQNLERSKESVNELERKVNSLSYLSYIPFAGNYQKDAVRLVNTLKAGIEAGKLSGETILPYSDLLGLQGKSTFVSGSADDRIKTAVETLDKILPSIDGISDHILTMEESLEGIDPGRYPVKLGKYEIRERLVSMKSLFRESAKLFVEAKPLLKKIPELLGTDGEKRYLVIFQNDAELRPTGGFITAYAIFKVEKGKFTVERADDIYKLDNAKSGRTPAPDPIKRYHINVNYLELRDSNLSPDFTESMKIFQKLIDENISGFPSYDGIIALDTHVLTSVIDILGEFNIYGRTFSSENDPRCNCPKAIYELEDYSTKPVAYVREDRKDIIGVLLYQIMQRALGVSPSKYWGRLSQTFFQEATDKHMIFYFKDAEAQKGIEALNFGGRILPFEGDYLHVNDTNFAGAKSNLFVRSYIKQEIKKESSNKFTKTLTVTYKNPAAASNCNLEAGQLCLNGILRNWVRIYVPKGSKLVSFEGSEMAVREYEELDKQVFEGFLKVNPKGQAQIKVVYETPQLNFPAGEYQMLVQKQAGTQENEMEIHYNGKKIKEYVMEKDEEIKFRL